MIEPFEKSPHAPYEAGKVPQAGWFAIEPACAWQPKEQGNLREALGLSEEGAPIEAVLTGEGLAALAEAFAREAGPAGLPVSKNHDFEAALGWIKALHAGGDLLWAWIEWTPAGHRAINNRDYIYFSTEYEFGDFELTESGQAVPQRLAGLTVTNYPNHAEGQIPMTNFNTRTRTHGRARLINNLPMRPRNNNTDPATEKPEEPTAAAKQPAAAPAEPPQKKADANTDPAVDDQETPPPAPEDVDANGTDCNGGDPALDMILEIADILGLDETADAEDVLAAVKAQAGQIEELRQALASANAATAGPDTNSRRLRYPGLSRSLRDLNRRAVRLAGQTPERDVNVRINGISRQVNCQEKAMSDFCLAQVDAEERKLARNLTQAEYARTWRRAVNDWNDAKR